jgi:hypothetical protein
VTVLDRSHLFDSWNLDRNIRYRWKDEAREMTREQLLNSLAQIYHDFKQERHWDWTVSWLAIVRTEARKRGITENDVVAHYTFLRLTDGRVSADD